MEGDLGDGEVLGGGEGRGCAWAGVSGFGGVVIVGYGKWQVYGVVSLML